MVYDLLISGGGGAGLSLATRLAQEPTLAHLSILLIDRQEKKQNDRTWCFWSEEKLPIASLAAHSWKKLSFLSSSFEKTFELGDFTYYQLNGLDFYSYAHREIAASPNIECKIAEIEQIQECDNTVEVITSVGTFTAKHVFDSTFSANQLLGQSKGYNFLLQHFQGWHIKTPRPVFDPTTIQLFDFRIPQNDVVTFMYLLPYSEQEALLEYTVFSQETYPHKRYEEALKDYLKYTLQVENFELVGKEQGIIPMTDFPFPLKKGDRISQIGTAAGACKPSTGYAFLRIQRDASYLREQLKKEKSNPVRKISSWRFRLYDAMILDIMEKEGGTIHQIFAQMFKKNKIQRVLRFLDEKTHFGEELLVMLSVPPWPFLRAIWHLIRRGKKL